ncbi:hypothetical protein DIZ27_20640 [Streptomyces sp. NWU339]|uniref:transposase n=1 Tax=Streptomyces sp. NWU339 TaxID=2185284 RepID=UPI000D676FC9|nr:hypothetical protein DIZ27_20640 [Streptomyces sp. NWU339]
MSKKSNTRKRYTAEFTRDAVASVHSWERTVTEGARELGASAGALRNRAGQDQADRGHGSAGAPTGGEEEELRCLRRENREQRQTIEVLRKAAAFFAGESTRQPCATRSSMRRRPPRTPRTVTASA